jgi:uncharacterized protein
MVERSALDGGAPGGVTVEAASLAVGLASALRRAGLPAPPDRSAWLADAFRIVPPFARSQVYWTCRAVFVTAKEQLPIFDAVFAAIFDGMLDPADNRGDTSGPPSIGSEAQTRSTSADSRPFGSTDRPPTNGAAAAAGSPDGDNDRTGPERDTTMITASAEEQLHDMSFADLRADEIAQMRHLVRNIALSTPTRRSRRTRQSGRSTGRLDMRRTTRAARRSGGNLTLLVYARRRPRPRRLVLLCDVSGSMEPYTRVFLSLLQGAVVGARAEAFIFSTHLTRLTRQLALRNPDQALARAAASTTDWAGGTRLAESIRRFVDDYGRRGLARGAVVVVLSDGWAQDDPDEVGAQMARLRRLAYRIVWVNPRKVAVDYEPLVGGMAAALPYCDSFVSGHSYAALAEVAAAIQADRLHVPKKWRTS